MARMQNPNFEILALAVDRLDQLAEGMVFLGGCATGLLITDSVAPPVRVTRNVDAIVQVVSCVEYYQLSEKLRARGFTEDMSEGAPICRWVVVDVMPTIPKILGFGHKWFAAAAENAESVKLPSDKNIRRVSAPYFLITKLEAFSGRGNGDYLMSHDVEDVIIAIDGRPGIVQEVKQAEPELSQEISGRFKELLQDVRFVEAVSGHMTC